MRFDGSSSADLRPNQIEIGGSLRGHHFSSKELSRCLNCPGQSYCVDGIADTDARKGPPPSFDRNPPAFAVVYILVNRRCSLLPRL